MNEKLQQQNEPKDILIKTIRIKGFRGLENIGIDLEKTTVLTGANNTGKSSVLHALEIALGNRFVSQEDFFIKENEEKEVKEIVVDLFIIPVNADNRRCDKFSKNWGSLLGPNNMMEEDNRGQQFVSLRTKVTFDNKRHIYKRERFIRPKWPENKIEWFKENDGKPLISFIDNEMPFFYMDGQRDILKDIRSRTSYLGRMLSKIISFENKDDKIEIAEDIDKLNIKVKRKNNVLKTLENILKELNSAMGNQENGIEVTLFTKKVRDLYKGLSIYYSDQKNQEGKEDNKDNFFPMEYHGMGTRSWSSLLTLKAFIKLLEKSLTKNKDKDNSNNLVLFPIIAIEEPEAHLHPNAQKRLYHQMNSIKGQKIISTHSPYVAAATNIKQVRNLYKSQTNVLCGRLDTNKLSLEDQRKIEHKVMNTRGEILFSKLIILCEGETEEQALPIFAKEYFKDKEPLSEIGLNVIGVDGHTKYKPFLQFAKDFHIPFVIFSDGEKNVKKSVLKQIKEVFEISEKEANKHVLFLNSGENFETQLIDDGFEDEVKKAIIILKNFSGEKAEKIKSLNKKELKDIFKKEKDINKINPGSISKIDFEKIPDEFRSKFNKEKRTSLPINKTQFAPIIAEQIIDNREKLPSISKVYKLFQKVENILDNERSNGTI